MRKTLLTLLIVASFFSATAQTANPFMNDANGRPLYLKTDYRAEGSPYYDEEYRLSEITTMNGQVYYNVKSRFNILENQLEYLADDGKPMVTSSPIKKVKFLKLLREGGKLEDVWITGVSNPINQPKNTVYEQLDSGKTSLIRKLIVTFRDEKKYGEAVITRLFSKKESDYALVQNKEIKKMEKGVDFMLELLSDKRALVFSFIDQNNLKCKSNKDYSLVFSYYNSL